ncbi:hypothetical protein BOTBODRAFT_39763 [Botryobasidium botryosum FD-172 SS1]|uniref:Uncharacterized protein n=1 Tax=Botryobasidium botryosum (strain FD-172 SS1) TaxID=930990 RepID=A0A067LSI1_BOTB1|nr:hypothetical protein BOTBODRAFT_39763 [Botryobasidium botryosum FD-172 SS1]
MELKGPIAELYGYHKLSSRLPRRRLKLLLSLARLSYSMPQPHVPRKHLLVCRYLFFARKRHRCACRHTSLQRWCLPTSVLIYPSLYSDRAAR